MVEAKQVDLKLAIAYIPVCMAFFQLSIINIYVFFAPTIPLHSWCLVAMVLWCMKRGRKEEIFEYNSLLQAVVFSSMMSNYRFGLKDGGADRMEGVVSVLWVAWFLGINLYSTSRAQPLDMGGVSGALPWLGYCLILNASFFAPMSEDTGKIDNLKGFLFLIVSVVWVYVQNAHRLSNKRALNTDECILRFTALLMTTISVSCALLLFLSLLIAYLKQRNVASNSMTDKASKDDAPLGDVEEGGTGNVHDIFRAAMAERKAMMNFDV